MRRPWRIDYSPNVFSEALIMDAKGYIVAEVLGSDDFDQLRNAQLLVRAPLMLDTLIMLSEYLDGARSTSTDLIMLTILSSVIEEVKSSRSAVNDPDAN